MSLSLFATQAERRRAQAAVDFDQKPWGLLYKSLVDNLGVQPSNFQLVYPFLTWNWPTTSVGFISSAQYDFCSTVPQWSAVGQYVSSGDRFNQAYQEFLNVIVATTNDPVLKAKIEAAANNLLQASNDYITIYNQADLAYQEDRKVSNNEPPFTTWLGTPAGKPWKVKLDSAEGAMNQAQKNYDTLVAQANTPGLADALLQLKNPVFYSKLQDPGLAGFPPVPNWSISLTAQQWIDKVLGGGGNGGSFSFSNSESSYDYQNTWAKGSATVRQFFWQVQVGGSWQRVTEFETDNSLSVSVQFEAFDQITVQPSDWYNGPFVKAHTNGPYAPGYSAFGQDGTQAVFGQKGFLNLLKTGMFVGYKATFTIKTSQSAFNSFLQTFQGCTGIRVGPFQFDAAGGSTQSQWTASSAGQTFTGTSTSKQPLIFGVTLAQLPTGGA